MSSENVLCRQGDVWLVGSAADGRSTYVRDSVGLHTLARLVAEPGREFHALDLAGGGGRSDSGAAMAALDASAKRAYRQRMADLQSEIDAATHQGDTTEHLQAELDFLTAEIARGVGLGGRDRAIGSGAERARVRVTRALRAAIKRIGAELPSLGSHLDRTVRTGTYCVYAVDPAMGHRWRFDPAGPPPPAAGDGVHSVEPDHVVHVPRAATRFVGRESDLGDLERDLTHHQLLTLVGPAGAGKTRLAAEAGRRLAGEFPDGVWFCELASVTHGDSVAHAVAAALDVHPQDGFGVLDSIAMTLAGRHMLLIFDNCEHVLHAVATVVVRLMESCESITVLATSREPLRVAGQRVRPVAGLEVGTAASQLFCDRAEAADPSFSPTPDDMLTIAEICRSLDGMPLAIELAAARVRAYGVQDLARALGDRFRVLRVPAHDRPERHQTLSAAISWSYDLLDDDERCLYERLSVVPGPFDAAAAAVVCGFAPLDPRDVVHVLARLVDKSVVTVIRTGGTTRYQLLESLREYGQMRAPDRAPAVIERHINHFRAVAAHAHDLFVSHDAELGRALFEQDWHNIRAAARWAAERSDLTDFCEILEAVFWYCDNDDINEPGAWAESVIERGDVVRPEVYGIAGWFATGTGEPERARRLAERGLEVAPSLDDRSTMRCWQALQLAHWYTGGLQEAFDAQEQYVARLDIERDRYDAVYGIAQLGGVATFTGREGGAGYLAQARAIATPIGNPTLTMFVEFMSAGHAMGERRFGDAFDGFGYAAELARAAHCRRWEIRARATQVVMAGEAGRADRHELRLHLFRDHYEMRRWSETSGELTSVFLEWEAAGWTEAAAVLLGYLEANGIDHSMAAEDRPAAAARVRVDPHCTAALERGAAMDRDDIARFVIAHLETKVGSARD